MKIFKNLLLLVVFVVFPSACATTGGYEKILSSWMGNDVNSLIQSWGPPANTYKMPNGDIMYTFFYDGGAVAMPIGNMAYAVNRSCKTTFIVGQDGKIKTWRWEGNTCKA
jgi:hypothetical protein